MHLGKPDLLTLAVEAAEYYAIAQRHSGSLPFMPPSGIDFVFTIDDIGFAINPVSWIRYAGHVRVHA